MKIFFLTMLVAPIAYSANIYLSSKIYSEMPYTDAFKEQGALVRNINYEAVKELVSQLEKIFKVKLENRGEAHITAISPPEFSGIFNPGKYGLHSVFSIDQIHEKYSSSIQQTNFEILCVGKLEDEGRLVFYLVVETPDLFALREELQYQYILKANNKKIPWYFDYAKFYPHITIGFVNDDIHGVSKGVETCLENHRLVIY